MSIFYEDKIDIVIFAILNMPNYRKLIQFHILSLDYYSWIKLLLKNYNF